MTSVKHTALWFAISAALSLVAPSAFGAEWQVPRTADGQPDLQGTWTNATITPLERPDHYGNRSVLSDAEAGQLEQEQASTVADRAAPSDLSKELPRAGDGVGGYNNFWIDRGSKVAVVNGQKRTSLIIEPANGKVPPLRAERQRQTAANVRRLRGNFDGPEARPLGERCLLAFGSSSGPPMLPVLYNNHYQIVQTRDTVMILVEMVHDARIVRLGGKPLPNQLRKWMGDSIGRWEGNTLVVETSNFTEQEPFRGATAQRKVIERFTRVGPDSINYSFTVEDPAAFTQSWTAEYPFYRATGLIYEYACHEGNYALPGILAGAREQEKAEAQ